MQSRGAEYASRSNLLATQLNLQYEQQQRALAEQQLLQQTLNIQVPTNMPPRQDSRPLPYSPTLPQRQQSAQSLPQQQQNVPRQDSRPLPQYTPQKQPTTLPYQQPIQQQQNGQFGLYEATIATVNGIKAVYIYF
jgi:hypothetical protein